LVGGIKLSVAEGILSCWPALTLVHLTCRYVLTYIPDLKWCHLAPMVQVGRFGSDKPKVTGRPKWKLVDESLGKEVDISARFCIPIKARFMKRTLDADKEEWDVVDDGTDPTERRNTLSRNTKRVELDSDRNHEIAVRKNRAGTSTKPCVSRKRQKTCMMPSLVASYPSSSEVVTVKLIGEQLHDSSFDKPARTKMGRPIGSKNRPKIIANEVMLSTIDKKRTLKTQPKGLFSRDTVSLDSLSRLQPPTKDRIAPTRLKGQGKKESNGSVLEMPLSKIGRSSPVRPCRPSRLSQEESSKTKPIDFRSDPLAASQKSRKIRKTGSKSGISSSRPRRSAAPSFLGESHVPQPSEADKVPYQPRRKRARAPTSAGPTEGRRSSSRTPTTLSAKLVGASNEPHVASPRPTSKRWHPVRETRNGKRTPRARRREAEETLVNTLPRPETGRKPPETTTASRLLPTNADSGQPKRKATPTFSLADDALRRRRTLHLVKRDSQCVH
jgi:hypothetical protein